MIRSNRILNIICFSIFGLTLVACQGNQTKEPTKDQKKYSSTKTSSCEAKPSWFAETKLPKEIAAQESFCDFYQFSLQSFIYLMKPNLVSQEPNFYNLNKYPMYRYDDTNESCLEKATSLNKIDTLSASINQAANDVTIYDQDNNVVYYTVQFNKPLCNAPETGDLPDNTLEMKMAWKVLGPNDDETKYISIKKDLMVRIPKTDTKPEAFKPVKGVTLGLSGLHLVQATANHPEMIWTTFEHANNAAKCYPDTETTESSFKFTSKACVADLKSGTFNNPDCKFNNVTEESSLTGASSEICRVFPHGSDINNPLYYKDSAGNSYSSPSKYDQNVDAIEQLNKSTKGSYYAAYPVLKNYFIAGSLWQSNTDVASSVSDNQRGSLENSNTLMETNVQGNLPGLPAASLGGITNEFNGSTNCFGCHNYIPTKTASTGLSHIFPSLKPSKSGINLVTPHDFNK